jgi:hypothetical protein
LLALHGARGAALPMFVEFSPAALPPFPPRDRSTALTVSCCNLAARW